MGVKENYERLVSDIEKTALGCARAGDKIDLVCVTKGAAVEDIDECIKSGARIIGENRVSEILKKYDELDKKDISMHLIGHLQTNKVSKIIDKVDLIQSLDSLRLANEIDKQSRLRKKVTDVLVQINISREQSKHGIFIEQVEEFLKNAGRLKNIKVRGFMCIGPLGAGESEIEKCFRDMNKLFVDTALKKYDNITMDILSMGMTNDYKIAIRCGSNMIRAGSAIFKNT